MSLYEQWMNRWERKLATRDTNRIVRPFDWGTEWLERIGRPAFHHMNGEPALAVDEFASRALASHGEFYAYETPRDFKLSDGILTFVTPAPSGFPENDVVHAAWLPAPNDQGRVLIVLPQWNADRDGHIGLARLLNRYGISVLRMSLAYHAERMPSELRRADYHVSSNVGRTIHAARQSVIDARSCLDWLEQRGYSRIGILGTSLGSCIAFITAAHDHRIRTGIFNHISTYFSDVVWTGLATQHVRAGFGDHITQDDLRRYWSIISPASFMGKMAERDIDSLLIWARYDSSFLPEFSKQVLTLFQQHKLRHNVVSLPCAHYTTGRFPFNIMDGVSMCRFAARSLGREVELRESVAGRRG